MRKGGSGLSLKWLRSYNLYKYYYRNNFEPFLIHTFILCVFGAERLKEGPFIHPSVYTYHSSSSSVPEIIEFKIHEFDFVYCDRISWRHISSCTPNHGGESNQHELDSTRELTSFYAKTQHCSWTWAECNKNKVGVTVFSTYQNRYTLFSS
jgi:DNA modification methylase